jgi:hypothetical protein
MGRLIWGGLLGAPLIGLMIGWVALRFPLKTKLAAAFLSLANLYVSATLFGVAIGAFDWLIGHPGRAMLEVIVQPVPAVLWGLTFVYLILLWPLAYWNHVLLWRAAERNLPDRA